MFQQLAKLFLTSAAVLTIGSAVTAQGGFGSIIGSIGGIGGIYIQPTPPSLPEVQYRLNSYDRSIGNSWLGGSVHAYAGMVRQKSGSYELGNAQVELRGTANVLTYSKEVVEIIGNASNVMNGGVQSRSGMYRIELLGLTVVNGSFQNSSTFAQQTWNFNLFPTNVSMSVPVGPISVTIGGNAGCSLGRSANWLLPAATASVGLNAQANAYAFANASVSFGIPGFNVGVGLQGRILEQALNINLNASGLWGLSGGASYTLQAITLNLYAWATALWTWTTNLCSWSAGHLSIALL